MLASCNILWDMIILALFFDTKLRNDDYQVHSSGATSRLSLHSSHARFEMSLEQAGEGSELAAHSGRLSAGTQGGAGRVVREGGVYERTLMAIAEGLLRKLPYKDRALAKLLAEVPHLPPRALALLESLCCARVDSLPPSQVGIGHPPCTTPSQHPILLPASNLAPPRTRCLP